MTYCDCKVVFKSRKQVKRYLPKANKTKMVLKKIGSCGNETDLTQGDAIMCEDYASNSCKAKKTLTKKLNTKI